MKYGESAFDILYLLSFLFYIPVTVGDVSIEIRGEELLAGCIKGEGAADIGIGRAFALERFDEMTERMPQALREAADELAGNGFHRAGMIAERILSHFFGKPRYTTQARL